MTRDEVLDIIREHLADELELDPARITEQTHFREDLSADSLDLYTLVQELEDSYGVKMSDEEAARIHTVREAVLGGHGPGGTHCYFRKSGMSSSSSSENAGSTAGVGTE